MKAMILAAGLATRLRPLTSDLPKALVPLNGRPLIEYTLLLLRRYQIRDVIINLHHHGERIVDTLRSGKGYGMRIAYSRETEILGTGGGIGKVRDQLMEGPFVVINGDVLIDVDLDRVVEFHTRNRAVSTLILRKDENADQWGSIEIDGEDRVRRIRGKPQGPDQGLEKRMFTGVHIMDPKVFEYLPENKYANIMDAYHRMMAEQRILMGFTMSGYWQDLGTHDRYEAARENLRLGNIRLSYLEGVE